jgi:Bacterial PH domain/Short C-terminal domain
VPPFIFSDILGGRRPPYPAILQFQAIFPMEDTMADTYLNSLLGEKETILLVARQHWLVLISEIISEVLLSLFILTLIVGLTIIGIPLALLGLVILIAPAISLTRDVLLWSNRKYVITSRRVIQISGVISKNVADSSLEKVNDVKLEQSFFGRLLGYGDIEILTASELGVNKIQRIANPIRYKIAMVNAKAQLESGEGIKAAGSDVPALISQLDGLRQKGVISEQEFQEKKSKLLSKI